MDGLHLYLAPLAVKVIVQQSKQYSQNLNGFGTLKMDKTQSHPASIMMST